MTDYRDGGDGEHMMLLNCGNPDCDFSEYVYYKTKQPAYCCNACRQRAKRKRDKQKAADKQAHKFEVDRIADYVPSFVTGLSFDQRDALIRQLNKMATEQTMIGRANGDHDHILASTFLELAAENIAYQRR